MLCLTCKKAIYLAGTMVCPCTQQWFFFGHELPEVCEEYEETQKREKQFLFRPPRAEEGRSRGSTIP